MQMIRLIKWRSERQREGGQHGAIRPRSHTVLEGAAEPGHLSSHRPPTPAQRDWPWRPQDPFPAGNRGIYSHTAKADIEGN